MNDMPNAKTLYRIARSGRVSLARQTIAENRAWPAEIPETEFAADKATITAAVQDVLGWIARGQDHWDCGGIPACYNARTCRYGGPYPETTGYSIPTLLEIGATLGCEDAITRARKAADWLANRQSSQGWMRCNIEPPRTVKLDDDEIVLFDCGAILQGFSAMVRRGEPFEHAAHRLARFVISEQRDDGKWDKHLAFDHFGSHNALVAFALIDAGVTLNETAYGEAGHRCLEALRERLHPNGYIEGCEFPGVRSGVAFLHPFVYTIEGFLKAAALAPDHGYLDDVRPALDALHSGMVHTKQIPGAFVRRDMSTDFSFTALTAIAQLADVGFRADHLTGVADYTPMSRRLMQFLRGVLNQTLSDLEWQGGVPSAYPIDGEYLPFCVNNWGAKYFLDASIGELGLLAPVSGEPHATQVPSGDPS